MRAVAADGRPWGQPNLSHGMSTLLDWLLLGSEVDAGG